MIRTDFWYTYRSTSIMYHTVVLYGYLRLLTFLLSLFVVVGKPSHALHVRSLRRRGSSLTTSWQGEVSLWAGGRFCLFMYRLGSCEGKERGGREEERRKTSVKSGLLIYCTRVTFYQTNEVGEFPLEVFLLGSPPLHTPLHPPPHPK